MDITASQIISEVRKAIIGKDEVIEKVLMALLAGGHVLLEDVPGVGKTTLAEAFAKAMQMKEKRIQFTPDTTAGDVTGFSVFDRQNNTFRFREGAVFSNLLLADEINRTSAKTQAALLEAMSEMQVTEDGKTYQLPQPFFCIATQNPTGSAGTHPLPDSQLDRFMVRLSVGYPSTESTIQIVQRKQKNDLLETIRPVVAPSDIIRMQQTVNDIYMDRELVRYAVLLCEKTRDLPELQQGLSTRAVLALVQMAKACAFLDGRNYCIPQDIQELFVDVCAHRLILTSRAKIRGRKPEDILTDLLAEVRAPSPAESSMRWAWCSSSSWNGR